MNYFRDIINEQHYVFLENFCHIRKVSDVTETKNCHYLISSNKWIYILSFL